MRALESRLERGFFRVAEVLVARQGACLALRGARKAQPGGGARGGDPAAQRRPLRPGGRVLPADRDNGGRSSSARPVLEGARRARPQHVRLRDVDMADVFQALHLVTGQGFLVDDDVRGRVSVDLDRLTVDEMLAVLGRTGIRVSGSGRVRRVSRGVGREAGPAGAAPAAEAGGPPRGTFSLKRAPVRDLLAIFGEADPTLVSLAPRNPLGRVTLWTKDVSMSDLRTAILDAVGLSERQEDGRRVLFRPEGPAEAVVPLGELPSERRLVMRPQDLTLTEFQVAGVVATGGAWTALAYLPTGTLGAYRVGDRLADATITEVHSTDVLLATDEGPVRLTLPPLQ